MNSNKLKKIIYSILKEILEGEDIPKAEDYDITNNQFFEIIMLMKNEGYLNPKKVSFFIDGSVSIIKAIDTITMKGIDFLEENNKWSKVYKGIKEFRDFLQTLTKKLHFYFQLFLHFYIDFNTFT